ncbi:hypothetical protein B0J17DRAFT_579906, partial [Rhizoctonia solani]
LHGVVGYITSFVMVVSCVGGGIVGRRAQGGDLGVQLGYYMLASGAAASVVVGCRGAFDAHREWMLRAWVYNGAIITMHASAIVSAKVITLIGGYSSFMRCAEVDYLIESNSMSQRFPQCLTSDPYNTYVVVPASWKGTKLGESSAVRASFGMSMLLAIFLHCVGVEVYVSRCVYQEVATTHIE